MESGAERGAVGPGTGECAKGREDAASSRRVKCSMMPMAEARVPPEACDLRRVSGVAA